MYKHEEHSARCKLDTGTNLQRHLNRKLAPFAQNRVVDMCKLFSSEDNCRGHFHSVHVHSSQHLDRRARQLKICHMESRANQAETANLIHISLPWRPVAAKSVANLFATTSTVSARKR